MMKKGHFREEELLSLTKTVSFVTLSHTQASANFNRVRPGNDIICNSQLPWDVDFGTGRTKNPKITR